MIRTCATLLLFFSLLQNRPLVAQSSPDTTPAGPALASTTGSADSLVSPDEVQFWVAAETEGEDLAQAKSLNSARVAELLDFLRTAGVEERYIQTRYLNVSVRQDDRDAPDPRYVASQTIAVELKDIGRYEAVSQGLLDLGVTGLHGLSFGYSGEEEVLAGLRLRAVRDARDRATALAGALGQTIGVAYRIDDAQAQGGTPLYARTASFESAGSGGGESLAPGELKLSATVNAAFYLRP